jgi:hypothetical protein
LVVDNERNGARSYSNTVAVTGQGTSPKAQGLTVESVEAKGGLVKTEPSPGMKVGERKATINFVAKLARKASGLEVSSRVAARIAGGDGVAGLREKEARCQRNTGEEAK